MIGNYLQYNSVVVLHVGMAPVSLQYLLVETRMCWLQWAVLANGLTISIALKFSDLNFEK